MKRHRLDVFALCTGGFFVALAVGFLFDGLGTWEMNVTWIGPILLIALGFAGVLSTIGRASTPDPPAEPDATP
jgi:hypothetical protein